MTRDVLESGYRGTRVLVTGDTGFKGSWLCLWLQLLGAEVTGFALPASNSRDHFAAVGLAELIRHIDGDIRDLDALQNAFSESRPTIVFHLAAQPLVRLSYEQPKLTLDTNIGGSTNLLECVRTSPSVRALIYVTSDKCYRNRDWVWGYRENDELGGHDPYSASKAAAELLFSSYFESFFRYRSGFGAASARSGNVIGGGDWSKDRIVPDCIASLLHGEGLKLRNPRSVRPWQHVLEPLRGYLMLGIRLLDDPQTFSGAWNFGPREDSMRSVLDLATRILDYWGSGQIMLASGDGPHEARLLQLNCDKANQLLQWSPTWSFDRTVKETVHWYRETISEKSPRKISQSQIECYFEEASDDRRSVSHAVATDPR